jgi:hypothetical protein
VSAGRRVVAAVLVVLGGLAVVGANVATWVRGTVLDRDRFVDALRPLAGDEDLRAGLTAELTERVLALQPAPSRDDDELASAVESALDVVLTGPLFETMWTDAVRLAHDGVVRLVEDGGPRVELDVGEVLTRVDHLLQEQGHDLLDEDRIEEIDGIVVGRTRRVAWAIDTIRLVERLAVVLPFVALGAFAALVALARRRALAVTASGVATAGAALVTLVAAVAARSRVLGLVQSGARRSAAGDVWDGLLDPLSRQSLLLLGLGLAVAAGGYVAHRITESEAV